MKKQVVLAAAVLAVAAAQAVPTAASRAVATVLLTVIHFRKHIPRFPLCYFRPMPWQELRNLFYIGIPAMSENISY
jgi:Na+-driven multidrug efflux pump